MQSSEAAQVMLGIYEDPIREMQTNHLTEYNKIVAVETNLDADPIEGLDGDAKIPNTSAFFDNPVESGKLFVKFLNKANQVDEGVKTSTLKSLNQWLRGEVQIYGHCVETLTKAKHLIHSIPGAGRKQLQKIKESVEVQSKEATQAMLESLETFKYDKSNNKDPLTKGEGIDCYLTRLENLINALKQVWKTTNGVKRSAKVLRIR